LNNIKDSKFAKGFTIIELMITVGIVAILVAFAVPAYQDYSIRAKIAECISGAVVAKLSISEYRQTLGAWPENLFETGLENSGQSYFCTALNNYQPSSGAFTIDVDESRVGLPLFSGSIAPDMTPSANNTNVINWNCSRGTTSEENLKYLPAICRESL
jgi:type IV pilus assembly protein PilA